VFSAALILNPARAVDSPEIRPPPAPPAPRLNGAITVTVKWSDLKIRGSQNVHDLWRQKDLGRFKKEFSLPVAPHSAELLKIAR
jgi:Alpha galactosidase C-terminal beta sandwich domain